MIIYPQWTNQNLVPDGNHLWSISFVNDNTGWIVGSKGFIKKTTNAGNDWVQQNSGTSLTLRSVQFINSNVGWICGDEGLIIKTTDGGQNWFDQSSGTTVLLTNLKFCNEFIGYVIGYNETILKTTDGGLTWVTQNYDSNFDLFSIDFVSPLLGFAVGGRDSTIFLKTTDGGLNWIRETTSLNNEAIRILNCVKFINLDVGFIGTGSGDAATSGSYIYKTTDGGETWIQSLLSIPNENTVLKKKNKDNNIIDMRRGVHSIYFKDLNIGYAVGGTGDGWGRNIFRTTDGGDTWQIKYNYQEQTGLLSVSMNSFGQGWAVGFFGVVYKTDNDGFSWSQVLSGNVDIYAGDRIEIVFMINDSVGWAGGTRQGSQIYPIILKTTNGGKIWETNFESTNSLFHNISDIFFLNENIGWAATGGIYGSDGLYKTINAGENWFSINATLNKIEKIFFITQNIGWGTKSSGSNSGIYKSIDSGINWIQKSSAGSNSVYFSDINNGWAVGAGGHILKSTDLGESWNYKTSGTTANLSSVNFYNNAVGMCVGGSGTILLSTDGGENWIAKNCGSTSELTSVKLTNPTTAWITGSDGKIFSSTDLGNTWITYNEITDNFLSTLFFTDENTGWFGGYNGTLLKYKDDILPVELISFTADVQNGRVQLNWQTATELSNYGFKIERKTNKETWVNIGFVTGSGNTTSQKFYTFIDNNAVGGSKFQYRLKQIDTEGNFEYSNEIEVEIFPTRFTLCQNYPNPFNPTTKIKYQLPKESKVIIKIYDILGTEVTTLINEIMGPGLYEVELNGSNLSSGTYIYRIVAGEFVDIKKMILIK